MRKYYDSMRGWTMGSNYYVKTFLGDPNPTWNGNKGDFYWTYHKYQKVKRTLRDLRYSFCIFKN